MARFALPRCRRGDGRERLCRLERLLLDLDRHADTSLWPLGRSAAGFVDGASRFEVEGGDNSVQEFGLEADGTELVRAARTTHAYFAARAQGDWAGARARLVASVRQGLGDFAGGTSSGSAGCRAGLAALAGGLSSARAYELTEIDAASLRREGSRAFVLFTAPLGHTVYALSLHRENGAWRLAAVEGSVLLSAPASSGAGE